MVERLFIFGLLILISATIGGVLSLSQNPTNTTSEKATPVQEGVKSSREKVHGRLFPKNKTGRNLDELISTGSGEIIIKSIVYPSFIKGGANCPSYPNQALTSYAHQADVIITGSMQDKVYSQLTENNDFIFSEYNVTVEEILKDNENATIRPNSNIAVVRPGGRVNLNGREVQAIAGAFKPFEKNARYLLFLKFIPESGSYLAYGNGTFLLRDDKVFELTQNQLVKSDVTSLINEVRAAIIAAPCAKRPLY